MKGLRPSIPLRRRAAAVIALCAGAVAAGQARAGCLISYEVGTADVGLASVGYSARAQDASTVLSNPAGMTQLEGSQWLVSGQVLWGNTEFSIGSGTSPALGGEEGGRAVGSDGWFLGGGGFFSYSVSPAEYLYGAGPDSNLDSRLQVALGGCGDVVGSFDNTATLFLAANFNWKF